MEMEEEKRTKAVKEDDISSKFNNVNTKRLLFIEYPGFIKNVDKMLETLGGEKKLSETYFKSKCRLALTYRPEDLNAHTVCGDLVPFTGLLMKVKRRKKAGTPDGYEYRQEIVGTIRDQYKFKHLMDYQYLTPEPLWNYFKDIHGSELGTTNFPPYFAPPTFARLDTPGVYDYKPDLTVALNGGLEKKAPDTADRDVARKRRQTESMAALFANDTIPDKPSEKATSVIQKLRLGPEKDNVETIEKLFQEERPLWSKLAVACHVNSGNEKLKKILQYFSYYWLSGPWRTMWCRMGYDPRKDPKAKIYQMIDFRVRDSKETKKKYNYKFLVPRRSIKNYIPRNLRNVNTRAPATGNSVLAACNEPKEKREVDPEPYIFRPDKMVVSRSTMYQLCDILDPDVQKIIHENDGIETTCDDKEGWFPPGTMNRIREQMTKTVDAFFANEKEKKKSSENTSSTKEENQNISLDDLEYSETEEGVNELEQFSYTQFLEQGEGDVDDDYIYNDDDYDYYDDQN